jgi:arylsulfatase B
MQYPGTLEAGTVYYEALSSLDLFPTSLGLAGIDAKQEYDGVGLMPHLLGQSEGSPHEELFWRVGDRAALRRGDWKIVRERKRGGPGPWLLFNLADNLSEENNLADMEKGKLEELIETWGNTTEKWWNPFF